MRRKLGFLSLAILISALVCSPLHAFAHTDSASQSHCLFSHAVPHQPASGSGLAAPDFAPVFRIGVVSHVLLGSAFLTGAAPRAPPAA